MSFSGQHFFSEHIKCPVVYSRHSLMPGKRYGSEPVGRSPAQSTALRGEDGLARVRAGHAQHDAKHCFARLERPATDGRPGGGNGKSPSAGRHQDTQFNSETRRLPGLGVVSGRAHRQDATRHPVQQRDATLASRSGEARRKALLCEARTGWHGRQPWGW